jgi:hypothetical protein
MRLDKEQERRRDELLATSARQLELSEAAAKRAESSHELSMSRGQLALEREQKTAKEMEEAAARFEISKKSWLEANPEALEDPKWKIAYDLVQDNPDHFGKMALLYAEEKDLPGLKEAQITAKDLGPGQQVTFELEGGGRFTARGLMEGDGSTPVPRHKLQNAISSGETEYEEAVDDARRELAKHRDKMDLMRQAGKEGTREYREMVADNERMARRYGELTGDPNKEWEYIQRNLEKLGLPDEGITGIRSAYQQMLEENERKRKEAAGQVPPDVDAIVTDIINPSASVVEQPNDALSQGGQLGPVLSDTWGGIKNTVRDLFTLGREGENPHQQP